jgi:hypothetical protein
MKSVALVCLALAAAAGATGPIMQADLESACLRQLLTIHRVYVDRLTGGETAAQMRDILIGSLAGAGLFVVTENEERADAIIRGAAEDLVFTDVHTSSDGINAHANVGNRQGSGAYLRSAQAGVGIGENESEHSAERRHEAMATVRLVNKEGDVIWSTTQESMGGKFRGASADAADKITSKLKDDFERARKLR